MMMAICEDWSLSETGELMLPGGGSEVSGSLYLRGCTGLTSLPEGLKVEGNLDLRRCKGLTSLPKGLKVEGHFDLRGCAGLKSLPEGLKFCAPLYLDGFIIHQSLIYLDFELPETVISVLPGMKLADIVDHYLLNSLPIMQDTIESVEKYRYPNYRWVFHTIPGSSQATQERLAA